MALLLTRGEVFTTRLLRELSGTIGGLGGDQLRWGQDGEVEATASQVAGESWYTAGFRGRSGCRCPPMAGRHGRMRRTTTPTSWAILS
jgi:hypothetical protein